MTIGLNQEWKTLIAVPPKGKVVLWVGHRQINECVVGPSPVVLGKVVDLDTGDRVSADPDILGVITVR